MFIRYLRQNLTEIILFAVFALIFMFVFFLYNVNTEAVIYAALLCFVILTVVVSVRFNIFLRRHKQREHILENIFIMTEELPEPATSAEYDYIRMIKKLHTEYKRNISLYQQERSESIDYYSTWIHQIKTPISVMMMILQSEDTEEHRELLAELFRIEQYAEMALCYIRLDSISSDFVFKVYSLDDIIRTAVRKYAPQFIRKKLTLQYSGTQVTVLTDEKWLLFIIEQILSNAVKYTEKGGVTITVSPDKLLCITDTGIGISSEDLPRIFEKGFTGYNGRADKKSTGIGLYLCKKASDKLSHRITAESVPGKGSTFSIDLQSVPLETE
ncbi:MAG: sensor histidine kinase [Ruminococcus sp.]